MKTHPIGRSALIAVVLLFAPFGRADEAAYKLILEERETVLTEILALQEQRYASGTADENAVTAARLALFSFRRDTAASPREQAKSQEMIVQLFEKELAQVEGRAKAGLADRLAILEVRARLLAARQLLEEFPAQADGG